MLPPRGDFAQRLLMERPDDVRLSGHGFIAVRNVTTEELSRGASGGELRASERALFESHPQLRCLSPEVWGVETLVGKLQRLQAAQLDAALPPLSLEIESRLVAAERALRLLPPALHTAEQKRAKLLDVVQTTTLRMHELITATDTAADKELHVAARTHDACTEFTRRVVDGVPDFLSDGQLASLATHVAESRGVYLANFLHGAVFRRVIKQSFVRRVAPRTDSAGWRRDGQRRARSPKPAPRARRGSS